MYEPVISPGFLKPTAFQHFPAEVFPTIHPVHWLNSHFAVGGWSPLKRLSGMLTAHMTQIAPRNGFTWHPHRGLEIYTWVLEGTLHHEDSTGSEGDIGPGELQRMFSGDWIEHQELNLGDTPVRVIQIWFAADPHYRGLPAHYQQPASDLFPVRTIGKVTGDAKARILLGPGSPMEQHTRGGRLEAVFVEPGGRAGLDKPALGEDLFLYVTDGAGQVCQDGKEVELKPYDVVLTRPDAPDLEIAASPVQGLQFLNFYLPSFLD